MIMEHKSHFARDIYYYNIQTDFGKKYIVIGWNKIVIGHNAFI